MADIYSKKGRLLAPRRVIYFRKPEKGRGYVENVKVTYSWVDMKYAQGSDIAFSNSFTNLLKSFAKDGCVVSKLLLKAAQWQNYTHEKHVNYISFRDAKGLISFTPFGKELITDGGRWSKTGRQTTKPAKFAREFLNPLLVKRLNDKHFNLFATKFKAYEEESDIRFERTTFDVAYDDKNYATPIGSCMSGKDVGTFYNKFDCVPMVARRNDGKLVARTILWNNVEVRSKHDSTIPTEVHPFIDRVYYNAPEFAELFARYADENGIMHRQGNGISFCTERKRWEDYALYVTPKEGVVIADIKLYPYLDTFRYGDYADTNMHSSYKDLYTRFTYDRTTLERNDNGYKEGYVMEQSGRFTNPDDCILYRTTYYLKTSNYCVTCVDDGNVYYYLDDRIISLQDNVYCLQVNTVLCAHSGERVRKCHAVTVYNTGGRELQVHKRYVQFYLTEAPKAIDKIDGGYTFNLINSAKREECHYDYGYSNGKSLYKSYNGAFGSMSNSVIEDITPERLSVLVDLAARMQTEYRF